MTSCEIATAVTAAACSLANGRSPQELALLASMFSQLGDTLATIAAQQEFCQEQKNP